MLISRRFFLKIVTIFIGIKVFFPWRSSLHADGETNSVLTSASPSSTKPTIGLLSPKYNLGVGEHGISNVYIARNSSPEANIAKVIEMTGGIEKHIGKRDIVVLKPNAQWYNQGMTNTDAMKGFIDLVLAIPNFDGEIIIAENHHIQKDETRGWVTEERNGQFNYNELIEHYQLQGKKNVTKYHWHNAGKCTHPQQHNACCGNIVNHPSQGDGYVWLTNCYYVSPSGNKCVMTYPVFTSAYSGLTIDLKNGVWEDGKFSKRPVKLINFSALNHHGRYSGVTASVKNLMGVVDMTCGWHGDAPEGAYNVHHVGVSKKITWLNAHWRISKYRGRLRDLFEDFCCRNFYHAGGALGYWMKHVRMPDLNIITAEIVGWASRTDVNKSCKTKAIIASLDPVALDYIAGKEILLPVTPKDLKEKTGKKYYDLHNPDNKSSPFYKFLLETHKQGIGNLDVDKIKIHSFDFNV